MTELELIDKLLKLPSMANPIYSSFILSSPHIRHKRQEWLNNEGDRRSITQFLQSIIKELTPVERALLGIIE